MHFNNDILVEWLQRSFGIRGNALAWIRLFLHRRCQQVTYNCQLSALMELLFGVPHGSVLGPLLFLMYTAELFDIIACSGLVGHSYANDTQVYISAPATSASTIAQRFFSFMEQVDAWMSSNRLKMNANKTQLIQLDKLSTTELDLLSARVRFLTVVSDLSVLVYSQLSMADLVAALSRACLFQLPTTSHAVITDQGISEDTRARVRQQPSRVYCNSHTVGLRRSDELLQKLYRSSRTRRHEW